MSDRGTIALRVLSQFYSFHIYNCILCIVGAKLSLPTKWVPMKEKEDFRVVYITPSTQEFKDIEKEFLQQVKTGQYSSKIPNSQNIKVVKVCSLRCKIYLSQFMSIRFEIL